MEKEIKYPDALKILKEKLKEQKLDFDTDNHSVLNVKLNFRSYYGGWRAKYDKINISINVNNGSTRGGMRGFDILKGDYKKLKEKIENLSAISEENKIYQDKLRIEDGEARRKAKEDLGFINCNKIEDIGIGRDLHLRCGWNDVAISIRENNSYSLRYFNPVDLRNKKISKELLNELCKLANSFSQFIDKLNKENNEQLIATPSDSPSASAKAEDLICVKEENQK